MGVFDDILQQEMTVNLDPDLGVGETVLYTPAGGTARRINANVNRQPSARLGETRDQLVGVIEISIFNHPTLGATSIDRGGDMFTLARDLGETPKAMSVVEILGQDAAMWYLRVS